MKLLQKLTICASILILPGFGGIATAQTTDIRQEIDELKQGQIAIQKELQDIKSLLEKIATQQTKPSPSGPVIKDVVFEIGNNPIKGNSSAGLILIEFTDYECPFCGRYVRETFPQIQNQYIDKGSIQYAVIDLPLPMHSKAAKAAEASHCAEEQGKFWEIHELMMTKQESLGDLSSYAVSLNLDVSKFNECVNAGKYADAVNRDIAFAQKLGINAVPGFIIGLIDSSNPGKVTGISMIQGAMPFASFKMELDAVLAAQ
jgi:protein-disulfide isomerase